jgi:hypothetical protein
LGGLGGLGGGDESRGGGHGGSDEDGGDLHGYFVRVDSTWIMLTLGIDRILPVFLMLIDNSINGNIMKS